MNQVQLGKSDIQITPVIMGTWQAGKQMWAGIDDGETQRALRAAFDAGITTIDTASMYGNGHSERIIARSLGDVRHEVVYATKVFANQLARDQVFKACHQSLRNLNTDHIDLYQIHWPAGSFGSRPVPVSETLGAMAKLKQQGKIRAIGVSNFSRAQLEEALQVTRIDSLQPPYSLFWRQVEDDAIPLCRQEQVTVLAYSPLAQGILTGKFGPEHQFDKGDHRAKNRLFHPDIYPSVQSALTRLQPIADDHGVTLGQLALAWIIAHPNTCAIAGARNAAQVEQNAGAARTRLSEAVMAEMDTISRTVTKLLDDDHVMWNF